MDAVLQLKRPLCSFATGWNALYVLFELKQLAECKSRAADKLVVLAERKSRVADKSGFTDRSRATGKKLAEGSRASGKVFWELSVVAIGCSTKDSSSDPTLGTVGCSNRLIPALFFTVA